MDLLDNQEHYTNNKIQPIEIMRENFTLAEYEGFLKGNVLKYLLRYNDKNGVEDLQKAKTYLVWLIQLLSEEPTESLPEEDCSVSSAKDLVRGTTSTIVKDENLKCTLRVPYVNIDADSNINVDTNLGEIFLADSLRNKHVKTSFTCGEWESHLGDTWENISNRFVVEPCEEEEE